MYRVFGGQFSHECGGHGGGKGGGKQNLCDYLGLDGLWEENKSKGVGSND